ncbi:ras-related GTP-binding protein, putative [Bodo saltans]|uniref:Ras-related GTP-binding protein, putative n=1 Tax=Bodo saltans TaxID=75058 RepID=A0A0S4JVI8_BODSA|nr:ras-related GTP-binding protein, putative [Bodo saltans]|eukprot:CUG94255.1 ras-related GTP-binding protein, putative [Bodo saltans]
MSVFDKVRNIFKSDKPGSPVGSNGGPKIWTMPPEMQREFQKGVKYNMKVILRGMRGTGKSALLARLHGHAFPEKYVASPEISAATIRYQGADVPDDHGTKVEMWDVVDVGIPPPGKSSATHLCPLADATTIDVYRGCHCVIFLVDPMRRESLDYVYSEARNVPATASILVALNFMDRPKPYAVSEHDVDALCRKLPRATTPMIVLASQGNEPEASLSAAATWVSISARTSHGISVLKSFFEIPVSFVHLATLETQMKSIYQKIEVHQAWMLTERARLNFEEKERSKASSSEDLNNSANLSPVSKQQPASPSGGAQAPQQQASKQPTPAPAAAAPPTAAIPTPAAAASAVVDAKKNPGDVQLFTPSKKPAVSEPPKKVQPPAPTAPAKQSSRKEESNELSNDFFGDVSDDEDEKSSSSSSSSEDDAPAPTPPSRLGSSFNQRRTSPTATSSHSPEEAPTPIRAAASVSQPAPPKVEEPPKPIIATFEAPPPMAILLRHAPVIRDEDLAVDDQAGESMKDDFFGSDSDDDEDEVEIKRAATPSSSDSDHDRTPPPTRAAAPMKMAAVESPSLVVPMQPSVGVPQQQPQKHEKHMDAIAAVVVEDDVPQAARDDFFGGADDSDDDDEQKHRAKTPEKSDSDVDEPPPRRPAPASHSAPLATPPARQSRGSEHSDEEQQQQHDKSDSEEVEAPPVVPKASTTAPRALPPPPRVLGSSASTGSSRTNRTERRTLEAVPSKPVTAAAAAAISFDVSAMLAQMQQAIVNAPPQEGSDNDDDAAPKEKRRKEKSEKKEKSDKKEKKDKKPKKDKKAAARDHGSDDSDGGFVVEE